MTKKLFIQKAKEDPENLYRELYERLPDTMICSDCGDTFQLGARCKNYVKGSMDHIIMSVHEENWANTPKGDTAWGRYLKTI